MHYDKRGNQHYTAAGAAQANAAYDAADAARDMAGEARYQSELQAYAEDRRAEEAELALEMQRREHQRQEAHRSEMKAIEEERLEEERKDREHAAKHREFQQAVDWLVNSDNPEKFGKIIDMYESSIVKEIYTVIKDIVNSESQHPFKAKADKAKQAASQTSKEQEKISKMQEQIKSCDRRIDGVSIRKYGCVSKCSWILCVPLGFLLIVALLQCLVDEPPTGEDALWLWLLIFVFIALLFAPIIIKKNSQSISIKKITEEKDEYEQQMDNLLPTLRKCKEESVILSKEAAMAGVDLVKKIMKDKDSISIFQKTFMKAINSAQKSLPSKARVNLNEVDNGEIDAAMNTLIFKATNAWLRSCGLPAMNNDESQNATLGADSSSSANSACVIQKVNRPNSPDGDDAQIEVGKLYRGIVVDVKMFGAFVEIFPGKIGLCHIRELEDFRVRRTEDVCKVGDEMWVKCIGIDGSSGKVRLSRRDAMKEMMTK